MSTQPKLNLKGALDTFKKSGDALVPVFEAITNSLEAIAAKDFNDEEEPAIKITLDYSGSEGGPKNLQAAIIEDNGIGFTNENYVRFEEFINKSKGFNNRGTGRFQYLHRFEQIRIESAFVQNGENKRRSFSLSPTSFISEQKLAVDEEPVSSFSRVSMLRPIFDSKDNERFERLTPETLADELRQKFLLRFFLDNQNPAVNAPEILIVFSLNGEAKKPVKVWDKSLPEPAQTGSLSVSYFKIQDANAEKPVWVPVPNASEEISWAQFKFAQEDQNKNRIFLCSKNVAVQGVPFSELKVDETFDNSRFLTFFYGDVLDRSENVSDSVDAFTFPKKLDVERSLDDLFVDSDREYLFMDDISNAVGEELSSIYADVLAKKQQTTDEVLAIAHAHAIPEAVVKSISISATDDEQKITSKLFAEQGRQQAEKAFEAKQIFESLKELNPTVDSYQQDLSERIAALSELVDEQNKEELARYVIRREMVVDLLNAILKANLKVQTEHSPSSGKRRDAEGLVHDLIFKRKSNTTSLNDLWILNEEFLHFEGSSDVPLNKIEDEAGELLLQKVPKEEIDALGLKLTRRPDIYLFLEEGKCVIIELKATDVDVSDYLNQLPKYCSLIANYSKKPISGFYCYLIGETFNPLTDLNDYDETVSGDFIRRNIPVRSVKDRNEVIASQQIEIIRLSSLHARASRRNKSFADKLGVRDLFNGKSDP